MHLRPILVALTFAVASGAHASTPARVTTAMPSLWQTLASLAGSWSIADPKSDAERAFRISVKSISKGAALVETFGNPLKNVTETVYHRDGDKIMGTHYCAQGNQPRLVLDPSSTPDRLIFRFLDITNLQSPAASHLIKIEFRLNSKDAIERLETYTAAGAVEVSQLNLRRTL